MVAFVVCFYLGRYRIKKLNLKIKSAQWTDLVFYGTIGTLIGGRLGYVLFYEPGRAIEDLLWIFRIWEGGMSFHGGLLGVFTALLLWSHRYKYPFFGIADLVAAFAPLGIGLGRLGNFANTELPGRVTESFLGVHFPCFAVVDLNPACLVAYEEVTRHVSSLYQAGTTGIVVFLVVWIYSSKPRDLGSVSGLFLLLYGTGRFVTEFFREPDAILGFIFGGWMTMGQLLSIPLVISGAALMSPGINQYLQPKPTS